ncbi:MAG: hypothetical protein WAL80_05475 [Xanthobacteraceae bacterium]
MSKDPLALSALTADPPQEAEFDAVYAAVTATERGRWFLTEFAHRNRQADTQAVTAALARIEASIRGDAPSPSASASWRDLTDIAAAIEQARAAITAETASAADIVAAVECIQDVSFSLRECAVDASLCNAIDAALRDIAGACRPHHASEVSGRSAAELLDDVAGRLDDLIKQSPGGAATATVPQQSAGEVQDLPQPTAFAAPTGHEEQAAADQDVSQLDQFIMELSEGSKPSESVTSLALSLTSAASAIGPRSEFDRGVVQSGAAETQSDSPAPAHANGGARWHIEGPDFVFHSAKPEAAEELTVSSEAFGATHALLPESQMPELDEDPAAAVDSSFAAAAEVPLPPHQVANGEAASAVIVAPPGATMHSAASDSFAALRGISEDELNALFG